MKVRLETSMASTPPTQIVNGGPSNGGIQCRLEAGIARRLKVAAVGNAHLLNNLMFPKQPHVSNHGG